MTKEMSTPNDLDSFGWRFPSQNRLQHSAHFGFRPTRRWQPTNPSIDMLKGTMTINGTGTAVRKVDFDCYNNFHNYRYPCQQ
uniref:Uncharacterized protein n=1 Tax=Panagrellus redivivus TaxID=6233 RepID=A0A7E4ULR5_PANRE